MILRLEKSSWMGSIFKRLTLDSFAARLVM
jgi:hypothetical protein